MLGNSGYERRERDWYPTPPDTSATILPYLREIAGAETSLRIWEPAAGDGAMLDVLAQAGHTVVGTDIHPLRTDIATGDFLSATQAPSATTGVVTNPPYGDIAQEFAEKIVALIESGEIEFGAMLVRNEYDSAAKKSHLFADCRHFAGKITLTFRPRWIADSTGSPRHNYCWVLWRKNHRDHGFPEIRYAQRQK